MNYFEVFYFVCSTSILGIITMSKHVIYYFTYDYFVIIYGINNYMTI